MRKVELLSPAKDLAIGMAAINNGADAVYIGAPAFGARKAACNSLDDIETLVEYAHRFYCRVFVTLNTIVYDHELADVEKLINRLYEMGVDALIIQDLGILKLQLPPISLHASTQMHNYDLERIKFLDQLGFQRIVLARELSLEQIREVRAAVKAELEVFVHGALCVSLSGQCYLSHHLSGRSANRGECAQPCRMKWSVKDSAGKVLIRDKYVLSLKDLNLSSYIDDLIEAGVDSFKIEGRLKDENYVSNITNYYHSLLNRNKTIERVGSGQVSSSFKAEPERSFNRGYSAYFMDSRKRGLVNMDTPKSVGKEIGTVKETKGCILTIEANVQVNNGDGLCYLEEGELKGIKVNSVNGAFITCNQPVEIRPGTQLFRNYDHQFVTRMEREKSTRKIRIGLTAGAEAGRLKLQATDEDGIVVSYEPEQVFEPANNPDQAERMKQQLAKCGNSDFVCESVEYVSDELLFIPAAVINAFRRELLELLSRAREEKRQVVLMEPVASGVFYQSSIPWNANVVNKNAVQFYREHGAQQVELGFEKSVDTKGKVLMHTRYCLLYELGRCRKCQDNSDLNFPLVIYNEKQQFELEFDCGECFMKIRS